MIIRRSIAGAAYYARIIIDSVTTVTQLLSLQKKLLHRSTAACCGCWKKWRLTIGMLEVLQMLADPNNICVYGCYCRQSTKILFALGLIYLFPPTRWMMPRDTLDPCNARFGTCITWPQKVYGQRQDMSGQH